MSVLCVTAKLDCQCLGQNRSFRTVERTSAKPPRKDMAHRPGHTSGLMHRSKWLCYSITSSARARSEGGIVTPIALAVFRLMNSSYFVGACTGMSAGFSPFRMRLT